MNRSVQKGDCPKSIDWIHAVDSHLKTGKEYQDVLFVMVAPGPILPSVDENLVSVVLESEHLNTGLSRGEYSSS